MIRVGIIGLGYAAKTFHLPLLEAAPEFQLIAVSSSQSNIHLPSHPNLVVFKTPGELLNSDLIDLVILTSPNDSHFSLAELALQRGLHLVIEKPMTIRSSEAYHLCDLAQKNSCLLTVFHNRRWDGDFLTVKQLIKDESVGQLRIFESHFDRFRPEVRDRWRENAGAGSGIWYDLGPHLVDQALHLFGLPLAVTAQLKAMRENSKNTDYFHVQFHYEELEVILHSSPFNAGPNLRFQLAGDLGNYVKYGLDPQELQLKSSLAIDDLNFGVEQSTEHGTLYTTTHRQRIVTEKGRYSTFYQQLAKAISHRDALPINPLDAARVIELIEIAEQSSAQGRRLAVAV